MKIGLFGGSFDPVHFGHLLLAETALRECELERIVFVPGGNPPHKIGSLQAGGEDRAEMLQLAVGGFPEFSVSRFEIDSPQTGYTIHTLRHFQESSLDPDLYLILGADMFNNLPSWYETAEICRIATPLVACRPGFPPPYFEALAQFVPQTRLERFHRYLIHMPQIELSSSEIRERIAQGKSIRFQTPWTVETYIHTHRLYQSGKWEAGSGK